MCPAYADILHYHLGCVVPSNEHLLVFGEVDDVFVEFSFVVLQLGILKLGIWGLERGKFEKGVTPAKVFELIGQNLFTQLTAHFVVCVELAILILPL